MRDSGTSMEHRQLPSTAERRHMLELRLRQLKADVTHVTTELQGSTVILRGHISSSQDRMRIVADVGTVPGVNEIIDLLSLPGQEAPGHLYLMQRSEGLKRLAVEYFSDHSTWDRRRGPDRAAITGLPAMLHRIVAAGARYARIIRAYLMRG
jgi:BON domain